MKSWRKRVVVAISLLGIVCLACVAYGYFIEPNQLVVTRATITIPQWNRAFDGLKIIMIGDVHGGSNNVTEEKLRQIVALSNEQKPDLIVLLGDYISQYQFPRTPIRQRELKMPVAAIADGLSGLTAPYGVLVVLGNHDGWYGGDRVAAEFTRVGYRVLQNEVAVLEKAGARLRILGMVDHLSLDPGWEKTFADAKRTVEASGSGDLIVLQHSPDIFPVIHASNGTISPDFRLMLSAHTHGGQVRLPFLGTLIVPSNYGDKYARGHISENGGDMFVTTGVGTSVLPFRFGVPPEIVALTIRSE